MGYKTPAKGIGALAAVRIDIRWHPGLSVYASEPFLRAVADEYGWIGGVNSEGVLRCILPYTIIRKAHIRLARFRVETVPLDRELEIYEEKTFLDDAMNLLRSLGAAIVIPASTNTLFRTYPDGATAAPYGSHIIDLSNSEDILWKNIHPKHRNVIRNAEKKGVEIRSGLAYADIAFDLIQATFKRSRLRFMNRASFLRMVQGLGERVEVFIASHAGEIQGCAVLPFSAYCAYYAYGGTASGPLTGAMNLLQWRSICHFLGLGVGRYDFCGARLDPEKGSKQAGLTMYKERFGAPLHRGFIWKYPLRTVPSIIYSWAVCANRGGDIVDQERRRMAKES